MWRVTVTSLSPLTRPLNEKLLCNLFIYIQTDTASIQISVTYDEASIDFYLFILLEFNNTKYNIQIKDF